MGNKQVHLIFGYLDKVLYYSSFMYTNLQIERVAQQRDVERVFEQQMCSVMIAEVFTCFALGYPYPQADSI